LSTNFRDLLALEPLTADELSFLLEQSKPLSGNPEASSEKTGDAARGKTVALAFFETSTRTRISFGAAAIAAGRGIR